MTTKKQLENGTGDWDKLCDFMDENDFTCFDLLVCICIHLFREPERKFKAEIMFKGTKFKIEINKEV